jgi:hypothetical protein
MIKRSSGTVDGSNAPVPNLAVGYDSDLGVCGRTRQSNCYPGYQANDGADYAKRRGFHSGPFFDESEQMPSQIGLSCPKWQKTISEFVDWEHFFHMVIAKCISLNSWAAGDVPAGADVNSGRVSLCFTSPFQDP